MSAYGRNPSSDRDYQAKEKSTLGGKFMRKVGSGVNTGLSMVGTMAHTDEEPNLNANGRISENPRRKGVSEKGKSMEIC